ncbi:hypothetical protein [Spirillospora sp. NPDC048819]|uniref:hypothetical protein n=1 Tax=Spirillospora sp. NPDC048819 TaxID=3155268 RepID=UPI003408EA00
MTQMIEGPPHTARTVPPERQWSPPDEQLASPEHQMASPEQQWTDWGRTQASGGRPKARRGVWPAVVVPLAVLAGLIVIGGMFLVLASPAGAAGLCGGG